MRLDFVMRFILSITASINAKISVYDYGYRLLLIIYMYTTVVTAINAIC